MFLVSIGVFFATYSCLLLSFIIEHKSKETITAPNVRARLIFLLIDLLQLIHMDLYILFSYDPLMKPWSAENLVLCSKQHITLRFIQ